MERTFVYGKTQAERLDIYREMDNTCPICFDVVSTPCLTVGCECKRVYCMPCLISFIKKSGPSEAFKCATCRTIIDKNYIYLDEYAEYLDSQNLLMRCKYHEKCGWIGTRHDFMRRHRKICPEMIVKCDYCNEKFVRGEHVKHAKQCSFFNTKCSECDEWFKTEDSEMMIKHYFQEHQLLLCKYCDKMNTINHQSECSKAFELCKICGEWIYVAGMPELAMKYHLNEHGYGHCRWCSEFHRKEHEKNCNNCLILCPQVGCIKKIIFNPAIENSKRQAFNMHMVKEHQACIFCNITITNANHYDQCSFSPNF